MHEQRQFLRRLRFSDGAKLAYERQAPVISPERQILDPYHVWPDRGELFGPLSIIPESDPGVVPVTRLLYFVLSDTACTGAQKPPDFSLAEVD